jgi:beta-lactamase class D
LVWFGLVGWLVGWLAGSTQQHVYIITSLLGEQNAKVKEAIETQLQTLALRLLAS